MRRTQAAPRANGMNDAGGQEKRPDGNWPALHLRYVCLLTAVM